MKILALLFSLTIAIFSEVIPQTSQADRLVIIKNDWSSQIVFSEILAKLLQRMNISTEFIHFKTVEQWGH